LPDAAELEHGPPAEVVLENAYRKAASVAAVHPDRLVLGADTVVHLGGRIYGKAVDADGARETLRALSGRRHEVISGICLLKDGASRTAAVGTLVDFRTLDDRLVQWYVESEEWRERAGCYAIQGRGAALVESIEGDYWGVVGLPVAALLRLAPELLQRP
jgi:septum formation protein